MGPPIHHAAPATSTRPRGPALPPIDRRLLAHDRRGELSVAHVAELPELLGCPRVLEQDSVDVERIELTITEAVDCCAHPLHQQRQLGLVVRRHSRASRLSI